MAERKRFLLRIDPAVHAAVEKWAADDLRSVNAQIEFLLKDALERAGRAARGADLGAGRGEAPEPHDDG